MPVARCRPPSQQARAVSHDVGCRYLCQLQRRHGEAVPGKWGAPRKETWKQYLALCIYRRGLILEGRKEKCFKDR